MDITRRSIANLTDIKYSTLNLRARSHDKSSTDKTTHLNQQDFIIRMLCKSATSYF